MTVSTCVIVYAVKSERRRERLKDAVPLLISKEYFMFEKVNPSHPDKIADRIAGAIVDLAYEREKNPRIAVEVLIGHHVCSIIAETSVSIPESAVIRAVQRIAGDVHVVYRQVPQDAMLANNQEHGFRCGDNGIFKGVPVTLEQKQLCRVARQIYKRCHSDGKYILDDGRLIICQSNARTNDLQHLYPCAELPRLLSFLSFSPQDFRLLRFDYPLLFLPHHSPRPLLQQLPHYSDRQQTMPTLHFPTWRASDTERKPTKWFF